ncbi:ABC transporter permease [Nevskia soli]|jgi:putative ABC transport system permease protein|uniref:ABC transporter permease n=1 Tax=Nevskia soli TaxID=418856 RepID=UPI0015D8B300|nr:ABC transporter permease [Nevskia soli]
MAINISLGQNFRMALDAVWTHRFRSLLTILGIVIGITTVVTVASLLTGLRQGIVVFFDSLGPDNVFIFKTSGNPQFDGPNPKERRRKAIDPAYAEDIRRIVTAVQDVGVQIYIPNIQDGKALTAHVPGTETDDVSLIGQTANVDDLAPHDFRDGRFFTTEENARGAKVAVLGNDVANALFPDGKAVGNAFMLDGAEYTVVGVFAKAKGGFFGQNGEDTQITIPLSTAHFRYPGVDRYMIIAKAKPGQRKEAYDEIEALLRRLRHTPKGEEDDFSLSTPDQIISQFDSITGIIGLVAIAISGLGLLVGGIGVMNIMLVSVTERTREIGVRKAIGARRFDIIWQFLAEAIALTGVGGLLGIIIAVLVTLLVSVLVPSLPSTVPGWAIITGFTVSVAIGLFFGTWPAVKAAQLDPVEALRYE